MAFTGNGLENIRLVNQAVKLIVDWAVQMRNNADTHVAMANAQAPDLATLVGYVNSCATNYRSFLLQLNTAVTTDPNKTKLLDGLARLNCVSTDITTPGNSMYAASGTLLNASKTTYAEVISACTTFKAAIPQPASVWPE